MAEDEWAFTEPSFTLSVEDWIMASRPSRDTIVAFFRWCDHVSECGPPPGTPYVEYDVQLISENEDVLTYSVGEVGVVIVYMKDDERRNIALHHIA